MRTVALVALAALAGCAVGPDYMKPETVMSPVWRNAPAGPIAQSPWWRSFGDAALDRLEADAMDANLGLEQGLARIAQARSALRGADAALLPAGELDGNSARVQQSLNSGLGQLSRYVPSFGRTVDSFQLSAGASWDIDFVGGLRREREAARAKVAADRFEYEATRLAVSGELADAFWAMRGAQAQRVALDRLIAITQDQRDVMQARVQRKAAPPSALEQADAEVSDLEAQAPALAAVADAERNRIAVLLGRDPSATIPGLPASVDIPDAPDPAAGLPGDILRNRPDVRAAEQTLIAANAGIGAAMADYYPKVTLSGLVGQFSNRLAAFGSSDSTAAQGAAGLRWKLFDFGRVDAEVRGARGRVREARAAYRQAVLLAAESVETSFAQLAAARARLGRLVAERLSLAQAQDAADRAFRIGEISRDDALTAARAVAKLNIDIAAARRDAARAAVACDRAVGAPTT